MSFKAIILYMALRTERLNMMMGLPSTSLCFSKRDKPIKSNYSAGTKYLVTFELVNKKVGITPV